jgi:hypothetical protein
MVRRRTFTKNFWTDRNLAVPKNITRPQTVVEDSVVFLEKVAKDRTLSLADKALDAAKYMIPRTPTASSGGRRVRWEN